MKVHRIVCNIESHNLDEMQNFYQVVFGLDVLMDHGWIQTYGSKQKMSLQRSAASEGGSGTPVPSISIEVDDLAEVQRRIEKRGDALEYGPTDEPWGVRRFYVRDPAGTLLNVLQHS